MESGVSRTDCHQNVSNFLPQTALDFTVEHTASSKQQTSAFELDHPPDTNELTASDQSFSLTFRIEKALRTKYEYKKCSVTILSDFSTFLFCD